MSNKISIKQILVGDELYDLDSKYWGGLEPIDKQDTLVSGLNIKTINGESLLGEGDIDTNDTFFELLRGNKLSFFCIENVDVIINNETYSFSPNSYADLTIKSGEQFQIITTSDKSIKMLTAYPGALNIFYDWLEGVDSFSNILFDMNVQDMYVKWNQGHQGQYHVQFAQYLNCVFWSDNPYISDISIRTNYTLYNSFQLPLCYSSIPENTFKSFYCAYGVSSDPNWSNPTYKESFALATHATQVFSYYGLHSIGVFDMDSSYFNITLPKDCRGLMYGAGNILNAGVFDAINVTNFGAKSGSWRDAFGLCYMLKNLYIKNLKVNINVSWSPINQESLNYILDNAANTNNITIYLSPYTYYSVTDSNKSLATEKNITLSLISTNFNEDNRLSKIKIDGDGSKYLSDDGTYKTLDDNTSQLEEINSHIEENERVVSMALNELNTRCDALANAIPNNNSEDNIAYPILLCSETEFTINPNVFHIWGEIETLNINLGEEVPNIMNEYCFQFEVGETVPTLILPDSIKWINGFPTLESGKTYQCSIVNNIGVIAGV